MNEPSNNDAAVKALAAPRRVDDEYRSGVHTPDWWTDVMDNDATMFVPALLPRRVKDAALREYARRQGATLRTRRETIDGVAGTVYWAERKPKP